MRSARIVRFARRGLAALTLVGVVTGALAALHAYTLTGGRWANRQVPFYINPANADGVPAADVEAAITQAAATWSAQSNADFQFYYAGRTTGAALQNNGRNEVFFRDESNGNVIALAYWWTDSSGRLLDADIVYYDATYQFFGGSSGCTRGFYIQDIAIHELGHGLGLHHSSVSAATMAPSIGYCSQAWRTLDADDIAGIEALYPPGGGAMSPPTAPANLAARRDTATPSSAIAVSWSDPSNEDDVRLERAANGGSWLQVAILPANSTAYRDTGLAASTTYTYRARATNSAGFSDYSNAASAATAAPSAPTAPANPSPGDRSTEVNWDATLGWSAANADQYDLYFGTSSNPPAFAANLSSPAFSLGKLAEGKTFYWRVVSKNAAGSASGPVWSFTTKARGKGKGRNK